MLKRSFDGAFGAEDFAARLAAPRLWKVEVGEVARFLSLLSSPGSMTSDGRVYEGGCMGREGGADISTSSISSTVTVGSFFAAGGGDLTDMRCFLGGEGDSSSDTSSTTTALDVPLIPFAAPFSRVLRRDPDGSGDVTLFCGDLTPTSSGGGRDRLLPCTPDINDQLYARDRWDYDDVP